MQICKRVWQKVALVLSSINWTGKRDNAGYMLMTINKAGVIVNQQTSGQWMFLGFPRYFNYFASKVKVWFFYVFLP